MVVVVAAAFLVVTYSRLISKRLVPLILRLLSFFRRRRRRRRWFLPSTTTDLDSLPPSDPFDLPLSPYGLDASAIKTLPLSLYTSKTRPNNSPKDCAVCLLEFEDNEYVRTLPVCSHAFHVDCIDVWLKSHANCPLCRAGIFAAESPFTPLMAARIRPSLDDPVFENNTLESLTETPLQSFPNNTITEITEEPSPRRRNGNSNCEERFNFVLKRFFKKVIFIWVREEFSRREDDNRAEHSVALEVQERREWILEQKDVSVWVVNDETQGFLV